MMICSKKTDVLPFKPESGHTDTELYNTQAVYCYLKSVIATSDLYSFGQSGSYLLSIALCPLDVPAQVSHSLGITTDKVVYNCTFIYLWKTYCHRKQKSAV